MRHWWWKSVGVLLLLYTCTVGLLTPLSPGIVHVAPDRIAPGRVTLEITGYNTHFSSSSSRSFWLENATQRWCAESVEPVGEDRVHAVFNVPAGLRSPQTSVAAFTNEDGLLRLNDALWTEGLGNYPMKLPDACIPANTRSGQLFTFPDRAILNETIRNLFFHVPMWFTMILLMSIALYHSIRYLRGMDLDADRAAVTAVNVSLLFAVLGLVTGSLWARATWGAWWTSDVKLNGAAVSTLIYLAYLVLRGSVPDAHKRARLAAVYNIFAFVLMLLFIMVAPRLTDSLHPGNGGNPAFSQYDLDSHLRAVFYPAVLGWMLFGLWAWTLTFRLSRINIDRA